MGATAALHARNVLANVQRILAIELLCAAQALDFRLALVPGTAPGSGVAAAHAAVRAQIAHVDADRELGPDIDAALRLVRAGDLATLAG
jgi:histidine ammonia-lyase